MKKVLALLSHLFLLMMHMENCYVENRVVYSIGFIERSVY